jgi:hypothetical protein
MLKYEPSNVFDPWSEDQFQQLINNILDLAQDKASQVSNCKNLALE